MSLEDKKNKSEILIGIHTSLCETAMNLYQDGDQKQASDVENMKIVLELAMEELRAESLEEWIKMSKNWTALIAPQISAIEGDLKEINDNLKNSKKITKSIASIDKAIKTIVKHLT